MHDLIVLERKGCEQSRRFLLSHDDLFHDQKCHCPARVLEPNLRLLSQFQAGNRIAFVPGRIKRAFVHARGFEAGLPS